MGGDDINKWEKEVLESQYDSEAKVMKDLERQYRMALLRIESTIRMLQSDELSQSKIYRIQHQQALKKQIEAILEQLHTSEFETISKYLEHSYTDAYVGAMYSMHGQGVPVITPIDQEAVVRAVVTDSKLSAPLYTSLGYEMDKLKKRVREEISRGIASSMSYDEIARNIRDRADMPLNSAKRVARTEVHRINCQAQYEAALASKGRGANIVKQWSAVMDSDVRSSHRHLDRQIRELEEKFSNGLMYPGHHIGKAEEVINCRCVANIRARWALDETELQTMKERAEFFKLDKTDSFTEFREKYLKAAAEPEVKQNKAYTLEDINKKATDALLDAYDDRRKHFGLNAASADELRKMEHNPFTADYTGLSVQTADAFNNTITKLSEEYYTGFTRIEVADPKKTFGATHFAKTRHNNSVGQKTLEINPQKTKDYDKLIERIEELSKKGHAIEIASGKAGEYIPTHEFAHSLLDLESPLKNYVGMDVKPMQKARKEIQAIYDRYVQEASELEKACKDLEKRFLLTSDMDEMAALQADYLTAKENLKRVKISGYSLKSADEFMAEAFTQAKIGTSKSTYTDEVMEVLDRHFKKTVRKAVKTVEKPVKSGIIDIEIDALTPCLRSTKTGELVETYAKKIDSRKALKKYNETTGWNVDWSRVPDDVDVFALRVKGSKDIQGLVGIKDDKAAKAVYLHWASTSPNNNKLLNHGQQEFEGVGGHLFAIAAEQSIRLGYGGYMYGFAANANLIQYYHRNFGAEHIGMLHPYHFIIDEMNAQKKILEVYNYEWK